MKIKEFITNGWGYLISLAIFCAIAFNWGCEKGEKNEKARQQLHKKSISQTKYLYLDSCRIAHVKENCIFMTVDFRHAFITRVPISEATMKTINRCCFSCITDEVYDSLKICILRGKDDGIKELYNALIQDGYEDLGSEDKFREFVKDVANVKKLYGVLKRDGYTEDAIGSEDDFITRLMLN